MGTTPPSKHAKKRRYTKQQIVTHWCIAIVALALAVALAVWSVRAAVNAADSATQAAQSAVSQSAQPSRTAQSQAAKSSAAAQADASASPSASATTQSAEEKAAAEEKKAQAALEAPISDADRTEILDKARQAALEDNQTPHELTYCVASKGDVGSLTGFENTVFRVLNDTKGWPRAGVYFEQVSDGCDFTITLAEPQYMTSFSSGCSEEYSCRVGDDVIINLKRWNNGIEAWLDAGGTLSQYRTMVINHEVGHRLGHTDNETTCAGNGQSAPLMQEQSMFLLGCVPNQWPLDNELWTNLAYAN